jgi:hypothetical protein
VSVVEDVVTIWFGGVFPSEPLPSKAQGPVQSLKVQTPQAPKVLAMLDSFLIYKIVAMSHVLCPTLEKILSYPVYPLDHPFGEGEH